MEEVLMRRQCMVFSAFLFMAAFGFCPQVRAQAVDPNVSNFGTRGWGMLPNGECIKKTPKIPAEIKAYVNDPLCCNESPDEKRLECLSASLAKITMLKGSITATLNGVVAEVEKMTEAVGTSSSAAYCGPMPVPNNVPNDYGQTGELDGLPIAQKIEYRVLNITGKLKNWPTKQYLDEIQFDISYMTNCINDVGQAYINIKNKCGK